jgi:L-malate glycosyltransferase
VQTINHVLIGTPVLLVGGTEAQMLSLAKVLIPARYKVSVCCYYEYDNKMVSRFKAAGVDVFLLRYNRVEGMLHLVKGLVHLFKDMKPDIVHIQYVAPGFMPVIAARLAGIKTIFATVHQPGRIYGWKAKFLVRTAAKLCTAFFCVSKSVEESWFGDSKLFDRKQLNGKRNHYTIYNTVDIDLISEIAQSVVRGDLKRSFGVDNKPVVGIVGRLRSEKGHASLLDAMSEVVNKIPEAMLVVVGDGPERSSLELRAKSLGLEHNVLWLGQKTAGEVFRLYALMDVMVVPSVFEGFSLSAAEAMAASVPVVSTRVDGLSEVVEDGVTGYLVNPGDSTALAAKIIALLLNSGAAKKLGQNGYRRVREKFSIERFKDLTLGAYRYFA